MLTPRLGACLLGGTLLFASACNAPPPTTPATPTIRAPQTAIPAATPSGRVPIENLPRADLDPGLLTAVCDPEPIQLDPEAGETTIFCHDAVVLGLRAASRATPGPITRMYVQRPVCATTPCSVDDLSTATVIVWGAAEVVAVRLDSRLDTLAPPDRLLLGIWPPAERGPAPDTNREAIDSAPAEVADRVPFPYCGKATYDTPPSVFACLAGNVLLGRPAEAIHVTFGTEGGEVVDIVRFDGSGALTRYRHAEGRWIRQFGSLILGAPGGSATFEAWDGGEPID